LIVDGGIPDLNGNGARLKPSRMLRVNQRIPRLGSEVYIVVEVEGFLNFNPSL
jgi:hypothetical protein